MHEVVARFNRSKRKRSDWMDGAIKPLAKVLAREKNLHMYLIGPCGLRCACIIVLYSDKAKRPLEQEHWSLTVMPNFNGDNLELWYDTYRVVREYPSGSIGELNSMGNEILPLPESTEEIIALLEHSKGIQRRHGHESADHIHPLEGSRQFPNNHTKRGHGDHRY